MNGKGCFHNPYPIHRLIIEEGVRENPLCENVRNALPELSPEYIRDSSLDPLTTDSTTLILCRNKGRFLKSCPGTKEYLCCKYNFLNIGLNCPINCTYCILQIYLNTASLVIYINYQDLFDQITDALALDPSLIRVGTGELTDSLALDPLTGLSPMLIDFFSCQRKAFLELKTKSDHIDHLLNLDHQGQTIISWSLNPQSVMDSQEGLCAPLDARIEAAKRCQMRGYKVGFHFDPILFYKGWETDYEAVTDALFDAVDDRHIAWISLGCFRFMPPLKEIIQKKFPHSTIIYEEFIPGLDKKMRYPQPLRIDIYSKMVRWIRRRSPGAFIYLCMESPEVWKGALGYSPCNNDVLKSWLDERCAT